MTTGNHALFCVIPYHRDDLNTRSCIFYALLQISMMVSNDRCACKLCIFLIPVNLRPVHTVLSKYFFFGISPLLDHVRHSQSQR